MTVHRARAAEARLNDVWLDSHSAAPAVAVLDPAEALVVGGAGQDFIHVAGDGLIPPAGFTDRPTATAEDDEIEGRRGDDIIHAGSGDDTIYGGIGNDTLYGGVGADLMYGGLGDNTYYVDDVGDLIFEDDGVNTIYSSVDLTIPENVTHLFLLGTADLSISADPTSAFNYGSWSITGNAGDNTLSGGYGEDTIFGGDGDDTIRGQVSTQFRGKLDALHGEGGDDYLIASASNPSGNTLDGGAGDDTMQGSGSTKDFFYVDSTLDVIIDTSRDYVFSTATFTLTFNLADLTLLGSEDIDGTGNATWNRMTGNAGSNILWGAEGNDTLDGGDGADVLHGGLGDDLYWLDDENDAAIEGAGDGGLDTVNSSANHTLSLNLENLVLLGELDLAGEGNAGANVLTGNLGDNDLDGQGGGDRLLGGDGDDILKGDEGDDTLDGGRGSDTLMGAIGLNLATYAGSDQAVAVDLAILGPQGGGGWAAGDTLLGVQALEGSQYADVLSGDSLANTLIGGGGFDTLSGGLGDDAYVTDGDDTILEMIDGGFDSVTITGSYILPENIEALTLSGLLGIGNGGDNQIRSQGFSSVRLEGRDGDDQLISGAGSDTLDGGLGRDTLTGGAGNDTYFVDDVEDLVEETSSAGLDHVFSSVSHTLGVNVETLTLTGSADANSKGNFSNNLMLGNAGANRLQGVGGADTLVGGAGNDSLDGGDSADVMTGGSGDDLYAVDSLADTVTELAGEGVDGVLSSVDLTLSANIENLTLTDAALVGRGNNLVNTITGSVLANTLSGAGRADFLFGELGDDSLLGERGNDVLNGGQDDDTLSGGRGDDDLTGGQGVDVLTGGLGADTFVFRTPSGTAVGFADRITDFRRAQGDLIDLFNIDADLALEGNQAFILGGSAFSNTAGELIQVAGAGGVTLVLGDTTGDGVAEFVIELAGAPVLVAADFIL